MSQRLNLKITEIFRTPTYPIRLFDEFQNEIFRGESDRDWIKREYNDNDQILYEARSDGFWERRSYDKHYREILYEDSNGRWEKRKYQGNYIILYEDSDGVERKEVVPISDEFVNLSYEDAIQDMAEFVKDNEDFLDEQGSKAWYTILSKLSGGLEEKERTSG